MGKEHRNAFELGLAIMRYTGFKSLGQERDFQSNMFIDYIKNLMISLELQGPDKLIANLEAATEDFGPTGSNWSNARDFAFVVGNYISARWSDEVGNLCALGSALGIFNVVLRNASNKDTLDVAISELKYTVLRLMSFLPEKTARHILELCDQASSVSPGSEEAASIATDVSTIYETLPIELTGEGKAKSTQPKSRQVFIVHGHDEAKKWELKNFLAGLGLEPIILHEQDDLGMTIIEKFEYYASQCGFAVILLTPDDQTPTTETTESRWRARQNVIMEMGWFMAKLGRDRILIVHKGQVEIPSDILGIIYLPFQQSILEVSEKMRQRLKGLNLI